MKKNPQPAEHTFQWSRDAADAEKLAMLVKMVQAMPQAGAAKFNLQTANGTVKLAVQIPEEELKKAIETQKASMQSAFLSQLGGKPMEMPKPKPLAKTEEKVVTNAAGETTGITLPGRK